MSRLNKTFRLDGEVIAQLDALVQRGLAPSQTALIEQLVRREARRQERAQRLRELDAEYAQAWSDPAYRAEQEQIERDFSPLDLEAWLQANPASDSAGR